MGILVADAVLVSRVPSHSTPAFFFLSGVFTRPLTFRVKRRHCSVCTTVRMKRSAIDWMRKLILKLRPLMPHVGAGLVTNLAGFWIITVEYVLR